jgi:hypothetical protein
MHEMPTSSQRPIPSLDQNGKQKYDGMHLPSQWRRRGALRREPNAVADERQKKEKLNCLSRNEHYHQRERGLHLFPLTGAAAAEALADCTAGDGAEATLLVGEPLPGHLPVLAVDGHAHAARADEHASAAP